MDFFKEFFSRNFVVIFIAIVLLVHASYSFKKHKKISLYSLLIVFCTLLLSISESLENYGKYIADPTLTLIFAVIGYTFRPVCVYLFILLTIDKKKNRLLYLTALPLLVVLTIYCLSFNPSLGEYIVYFSVNDDGSLSFGGGILRYTSHVVSLLYLVWFMHISMSMLTFKRLTRGVITLSCSIAVIIAAIIESFYNADGDIYILNTVIAVSSLVYYVYLIFEKNELDPVSGLYNKERYLRDADMSQARIKGLGIIKITLLENTEYNIPANNAILEESATILLRCLNRKMIAYRYDSDEFILLTKGDRELLDVVIKKYEEKMKEKNHVFKIGVAFKDNENEQIYSLINKAEIALYLRNNKNNTY